MRRRATPLAIAGCFLVAGCGFLTRGAGVGDGDPSLPTVVFLASAPPSALPPEEAAAWAWLAPLGGDRFNVHFVQMIDLPSTDLPPEAVLWWHYAAEEALPSVAARAASLNAVRNHLRAGGNVLLSLIAATYLVPLGIETAAPDTVTTAADFAAGRELAGVQTRAGFPLLASFGGGVYSSANSASPARPAVAYRNGRWPTEGRVWAVYKDEVGVDPEVKVGVDYPATFFGGGRALTIGAGLYFADADNHNRSQLDRLATDALAFLAGAVPGSELDAAVVPVADGATGNPGPYWFEVDTPFTAFVPPTTPRAPTANPGVVANLVEAPPAAPEITRYPDADMPFTLTSPQAVALGSQLGRIDSLRVHPLVVLRGLRFGIVRPDRGVTWLDDPSSGERTFTARPEGSELFYNDGELELRLHLTVDPRRPALVGVLAVRSPAPIKVIATWQAEGTPSWPQTSDAPGRREIGWDDGAQAVIWRDGADFAVKAGFGRETQIHILDFREDAHLDDNGLFTPLMPPEGASEPPAPRDPGDAQPVALQVDVPTTAGAPELLSFVVVGGPGAGTSVDGSFRELIAAPGGAWSVRGDYYRTFFGEPTLGLLVPSSGVEDLFKWAKLGVESLRTELPGFGGGIASGFGDATPGQAWATTPNALGAGALWAAMAADAYGDSALAAATLRLTAAHQGLDGRIPTSIGGPQQHIANRVADSAVFLVALANHVRTTGDQQILAELWPAALRAAEYLYAADPDDDGLPNSFSNLDRWSSDRVVQTTIHLAGLWGAALDGLTEMATLTGDGDVVTRAAEAAARVRDSLNQNFWNPNERRFNFAQRADGSFVVARTALPAVPMAFGLLETGLAIPGLESFSRAELGRDWGVDLYAETPTPATPLEEPAPPALPTPSGLPTIAANTVSPVFTGWAALAEYANHRPEAGFSLAYTNLLMLEHGNPGYANPAFADDVLVPVGRIAHSAAAQALTVLPVVWGMLGIHPNAPERTISISPQLPAGWDRVIVNHVRVGNSRFRLVVRQAEEGLSFEINDWRGPRDVTVRLSAHLPTDVAVGVEPVVAGAEVVEALTIEESTTDRLATVTVQPTADLTTVTIPHDPFPRLLSLIPDRRAEARALLPPGAASNNLRVVRARYLGGTMEIAAEGLPGRTYRLRLATPWRVSQVTGLPNVQPAHPEPGLATIDVTIPGSGQEYRPVTLEVAFER